MRAAGLGPAARTACSGRRGQCDPRAEVRGGEQFHVGLGAGPTHTIVPELHERERVGDLQRVLRVLFDEQHRGAGVAQLDDRLHDRLGGERREAEGGLVGDQHLRRVGERGRQAQHLLLAARQQAGDLLAPLRRGSGTARTPCSRSVGSRRSTVRFSSTVSPGKMPRASGTSSRPSRARWYDDACVMSCPSSTHGAERRVDESRGDRAQRRLAGAVRAEQRDHRAGLEPERRHRGALRRRRSRRRCRPSRAPRPASAPFACSGAATGAPRCAALSCSGTMPSCAAASTAAMPRLPLLLALLLQPLLADEREDAVGLLRELDGAESPTGSARSRSTRSSTFAVPPPRDRQLGDPVEDGRPDGEREAGEERAARAAGCRTSPRARARTARRTAARSCC